MEHTKKYLSLRSNNREVYTEPLSGKKTDDVERMDAKGRLDTLAKTFPNGQWSMAVVTERQNWKGHQVKKLDVLTGMVTMERNKEVHFPRGTNV